MRVTKVPESGPKRSLLDATERLVVEKGFDLVSVRDITGAIKANVAAVNYHFGSREALMDVVMSHFGGYSATGVTRSSGEDRQSVCELGFNCCG